MKLNARLNFLKKAKKIVQETRGWSDATGETTSQRSKEEAQDYRYMPEPDIPPIRLSVDVVETARQAMPKLPAAYRHEFSSVLPEDLIEVLLDYQNLVEKLGELENEKAVKKVANLFSSVLLYRGEHQSPE